VVQPLADRKVQDIQCRILKSRMCRFRSSQNSSDIPLHHSRGYPDHQLTPSSGCRSLPRFREILISPNQSRHVLLRLPRRFPLGFRFQEGKYNLEQTSLSLHVGRYKDSFHPFNDFVAKDEGGVGLKQATESESRCIVPDGILRKVEVKIEKVFG
jgi:hypothetical protein